MKKGLLAHYGEDFKANLRLAVPVSIGMLGNMIIQIADAAMIGQVSSVYLSAATVASNLFFLFLVFGFGLTMAIAPLVSEAWAAKKHQRVAGLFQQGLRLNFFFGLFLSLGCFLSAETIPYLNQPPEVIGLAQEYLRIISISILPNMVFLHYKQFIEGMEDMAPGLRVMGAVVVLNIALNWVLIYGEFGFPELGLAGAGYATLISRVVGMFLMMGAVIFSKRYKQYDPIPGFKAWDRPVTGKILNIGLPSSLQYLFEAGAFAGSSLMVGWIGYQEQAAHNIAISLASISFTVVMGISTAASIRVANARGLREIQKVRKAGFSAVLMGLGFMFLAAMIFLVGRWKLPLFYNQEPYVVETAALLLVFTALFQLSDGTQVIMVGALRGLSDAKVPAYITFFAYWCVSLPLGYVLGFVFDLGVTGIWTGLVIGLTFSAILLSLRFHFLTKGNSR